MTNNSINDIQFDTLTAQIFTSTGAFTYTPTSGMKYVIVELLGAGGGAGGTDNAAGNAAVTGGGGGGGYCRFILTAAQVGASLTGAVGAGGTAGAAGNNAGGTGGNTTLATSSAWTAAGGAGSAGSAPSAAGIVSGGAVGGTNTTGTGTLLINRRGDDGQPGWSSLTVANSGQGGNAQYGQGGNPVFIVDSSSSIGGTGQGFGGGGGGSAGINTVTDRAGSVGSNGIAIFTEFS